MKKLIGIYAPHAYALMRIVIGLLFICHGLQKVFGMFGGMGGGPVPLVSFFGVAGIIEIIGGAFITLGLFAGMWRLSPAVKWRWHILSAISLKDSGPSETVES